MGGIIKKKRGLQSFKFVNNILKIDDLKFSAEKLIICCGAWSNKLLEKSENISFPMRPVKGVSMIFKTEKNMFKNNLWFKNIYVAPRKGKNWQLVQQRTKRGLRKM